MKKFLNFRPALFCALALAAGILGGFALIKGEYTLFLSAFSLIGALFLFVSFFNDRLFKPLCFCFAFFLIGTGAVYSVKISNDSRLAADGDVCITGYATIDTADSGGYWTVYIRDAVDTDGKKYEGKILAFISKEIGGEEIEIQCGDKITLQCFLSGINFFSDGVDGYSYKNRTYYRAKQTRLISVEEGEPDFSEKIRLYIKKTVGENMSENGGGVALALLLGDKSQMDAADKETFQKSGVAHVFAVSGLHVGFLAGFFAFIIYGTKLNKKIGFFIIAAATLFYGYVVGFPPSAARAVIMVISASFLRAFGYRADMLSSMSVAAVIILLFRPLYLFDAGFLMSFGAVYGIATLTLLFSGKIAKTKIPKIFKRLIDGLLVTLGATLGVLPALAAFYGEVFLLTLISNAAVIPVVSAVFFLLLIGLIPIPYFKYVLLIADKLIEFLRRLTEFFAGIPNATAAVSSLGAGAAALLIGLFVLSGYANIAKNKKILLTAVFFALTVVLSFFEALPVKSRNVVEIYDVYPEKTVIASNEYGDAIVFSSFQSEYDLTVLENFVEYYDLENIYVVVENMRESSVEIVLRAAKICGADKVYVFQSFPAYDDYSYLLSGGVDAEYLFDGIGSDSLSLIREYGLGYDGFLIRLEGKTFMIVENVYDYVYGQESYRYDAVYVGSDYEKALLAFPESLIVSSGYAVEYGIKSADRDGNFTFYLIDDKIISID